MSTESIPGEGRYLKTCRGCKRQFRSNGRNARFAPAELGICKCLATRAKHRAKRAKERREYHKNPEFFKALSKTRATARRTLLAQHGITIKDQRVIIDETLLNQFWSLGCASPGCPHQLKNYAEKELAERAENGVSNRGFRHVAVKKLLKRLEAHHRDHDPFNNRTANYPTGSNVLFLCRNHHEHADRAKAGKAQLVLWEEPPPETWFEFLVRLYSTETRRFYMTPADELLAEYNSQ